MRWRFLSAVLLALLVLAVAMIAARQAGPRHGRAPHPPTATAPLPQRFDLGPQEDDRLSGSLDEVMPMHRAARLAVRRFDGKVLDIALLSQRDNNSPLIYRIRILMGRRDVVDIRMDALTGRFLEVRGADLGAARAHRKDD